MIKVNVVKAYLFAPVLFNGGGDCSYSRLFFPFVRSAKPDRQYPQSQQRSGVSKFQRGKTRAVIEARITNPVALTVILLNWWRAMLMLMILLRWGEKGAYEKREPVTN
jgi:hypothetical protein